MAELPSKITNIAAIYQLVVQGTVDMLPFISLRQIEFLGSREEPKHICNWLIDINNFTASGINAQSTTLSQKQQGSNHESNTFTSKTYKF